MTLITDIVFTASRLFLCLFFMPPEGKYIHFAASEQIAIRLDTIVPHIKIVFCVKKCDLGLKVEVTANS